MLCPLSCWGQAGGEKTEPSAFPVVHLVPSFNIISCNFLTALSFMEELFSTAQRRGVREKEQQLIGKNGKIMKDVSLFQMSLQGFFEGARSVLLQLLSLHGFWPLLGIWAIEGVGSRSSMH
uniref:Uncharacterized protein n=1 Tax=Micrurus paraensis TaxID=1970185 RepID=A0A2D4KBE3_9SAUR